MLQSWLIEFYPYLRNNKKKENQILSWSYAKAGVDVKKVKKTQNEIGKIIEETFKFRDNKFGQVLSKFGHYASLIDIGNGKALALHSDGCGTKVLISQLMKKFERLLCSMQILTLFSSKLRKMECLP